MTQGCAMSCWTASHYNHWGFYICLATMRGMLQMLASASERFATLACSFLLPLPLLPCYGCCCCSCYAAACSFVGPITGLSICHPRLSHALHVAARVAKGGGCCCILLDRAAAAAGADWQRGWGTAWTTAWTSASRVLWNQSNAVRAHDKSRAHN